jgi:serine phosphatase RsbU (regulator of sigma subunit)
MLYGGVTWRLRNLEAAKTLLQRKVRERTEEIRKQKEEIQEQASDIALKNQILEQQKLEIEQQHIIVKATYQQLTDSIRYARQLQNSIFGSMGQLASYFKPPVFEGAFVYAEPRDIVSGDFCWYSQVGELKILAAVDCTGHGVPGAFMTLLGNNFLQDVVNRRQITEPAQILAELDKRVIESFGASPDSDYLPNDGMDMVLLSINERERSIRFAAAKTPLYLVRKGGVIEYKGSRYPIGSLQYTQPKHYEVHELSMEPGDVIYLCSDGFQSQFGGERQRKYLSRRFKNFLLTISEMSPAIQEAALRREFNNWKGHGTQTDDVLVIGIKCL